MCYWFSKVNYVCFCCCVVGLICVIYSVNNRVNIDDMILMFFYYVM